jgi:hypothetical protein
MRLDCALVPFYRSIHAVSIASLRCPASLPCKETDHGPKLDQPRTGRPRYLVIGTGALARSAQTSPTATPSPWSTHSSAPVTTHPPLLPGPPNALLPAIVVN